MSLHGKHFLGSTKSLRGKQQFRAADPATGDLLEPPFADATDTEIDAALKKAADAHTELKKIDRPSRAAFLDQIAQNLVDLGEPLLQRTQAETALPLPRLIGERGRTAGQLQTFAEAIREGSFLGARIDRAQPDRQPIPKPDVRRIQIAVGPVVIFGASNFPLAFSVAGGDTASALAAGCPVVAKAHPNHPGASEMVAEAIIDAAQRTGMPDGIFSLLHGLGHEVGLGLVRHPLTRAVGFTGSLRGGRALFDAATQRSVPIPVFAEMGSTNPLFILPDALQSQGEELAKGLQGSVTLGVGQFCTNPGVVIVEQGPAAQRFVEHLAELTSTADPGTMLHSGISKAYGAGVERVAKIQGVQVIARGSTEGGGACSAIPTVLATDSATFELHAELREEIFGPSTLVVTCSDASDVRQLARSLDGQLTACVHGSESDLESYGDLFGILEEKAGRVLYGGFPTGVEVCPAMQHGGPYPSTTDSRTTSVGTAAIERFLRPVAYQSYPQSLLPAELQDGNPTGILRFVDNQWSRD